MTARLVLSEDELAELDAEIREHREALLELIDSEPIPSAVHRKYESIYLRMNELARLEKIRERSVAG